MKGVLEISKLLWIANLVLLAILGYGLASFILNNETKYSTLVEPIPKTGNVEITLCKETTLPINYKIILERNIFSSAEASIIKENSQHGIKRASTPFVKELRLLATVAGDEEVACAVIENSKTKIQDLYKTGDIIEGTQIERIERNRIILVKRGQREILELNLTEGGSESIEKGPEPVMAQKPSFAEVVNIVSPTEREINKEAFYARTGGMAAVLKKMEINPYVANGKENGIRISGLDDLILAKYVGFESGDIIQNINGQSVTNKRKAFQILKKARVQPSLEIQLLRNQEKRELSLGIR